MPTVRHPRALDDVRGHPPSRVTVNGTSYDVEDGRVSLPDAGAVERLAQAYGVDADALRGDDAETCQVEKTDGEVCGRELPCPYHGGDE